MGDYKILKKTNDGSLMKSTTKATFGFDSGANLGITVVHESGLINTLQMEEEEINLLSFWLMDNFNLKACPEFNDQKELEELREKSSNYKGIIEDNIQRMQELRDLIRRSVSTFKSLQDLEEIKGEQMIPLEARKIISALISESEKVEE